MANLDCTVGTCAYNKTQSCCKGDIMVAGKEANQCDDTCCDSFTQRRVEDSFIDALDQNPSRTISIDCEVGKCIYNSSYKCFADHVDIKGGNAEANAETACGTFQPK